MAADNLRIVYINKATAVGGSWSAGAAANLLNDYKSSTATLSGASFTVTASVAGSTACAVVLLLAKTTGSISMSVSGSGVPGGVTVSDTSTTNAGVIGTIGYTGGKYIAAYFTTTGPTGTITISVPSGTEISRVIVGEYWSPKYNTSFGVSSGFSDNSTVERTQAGDLYTISSPRNKTLSFDLSYLSETDKYKMFDLIKTCGKVTPIFVSIFPNNTDKEKEQIYQIYGKFTDLSSITNTMWSQYSSSVSLEEI